MEHSLTKIFATVKNAIRSLNPYSNGKMNTQSQRTGGHLNLSANVGNKSGKRKIWRKIGANDGVRQMRMGLLLGFTDSHVSNGVTS